MLRDLDLRVLPQILSLPETLFVSVYTDINWIDSLKKFTDGNVNHLFLLSNSPSLSPKPQGFWLDQFYSWPWMDSSSEGWRFQDPGLLGWVQGGGGWGLGQGTGQKNQSVDLYIIANLIRPSFIFLGQGDRDPWHPICDHWSKNWWSVQVQGDCFQCSR